MVGDETRIGAKQLEVARREQVERPHIVVAEGIGVGRCEGALVEGIIAMTPQS